MASLKVAVRVRPLNKREEDMESKCIIQMQGQKTSIFNTKLYGEVGYVGEKERQFKKDFLYDYSYWSANPKDPEYVNQDQVFEDLGVGVLDAACEGYNACIFAYGQTGAGKTYTMMGTNEEVGLIPRICRGLFHYIADKTSSTSSFRTEVSYLEIYNEHVRDLLRPQNLKRLPQQNLKVREHPKEGPYVEGQTKQHVSDYDSIEVLMEQGSRLRATASTKMNDTSSRSHAIFTIKFTQAKFVGDMPSETISKIHLVDLAGSERASTSGATGDRLKEGANINKSLVTLGIVISTLAENCVGSSAVGKRLAFRKKMFVPYRDSVLTFLLKDSLGGNSKTVMIAAISPADCNYGESLSTLRYAHRAKSIINSPTINEDPNVKLIRELRSEIDRLKGIINSSMLHEGDDATKAVKKLHEKEVRVEQLTKDWTEKWKEAQAIMQESELALRRQGSCIVLVDLELPHLVRLEEDPLRTGIMLYRIMHGKTCIGREDAVSPQDIVLEDDDIDKEHCVLDFTKGQVTLGPLSPLCWVNGVGISQPTRLNQGDVVVLGKSNVFKFNFPTEAAKLREKRRSGLHSAESVESLSSFYISPVRGSHGDLSMRSDCSSPITLDSGVEADIGDNTEDIRNQIADLIARHKEAEVRRMDVEKSYQTEINTKQAEIDEQRKAMEKVRDFHETVSANAKEELQLVRRQMQNRNQEQMEKIENQVGLLIDLKNNDSADEEEIANEKDELNRYLEDEWKKVEQYEMNLADIELEKRRSLAQAGRELERHRALCDAEREQELKQLEEQQVKLLELQEYLVAVQSKPSTVNKGNKATLESYIARDQEELEQIEQNIGLLKNKQRQMLKLRGHDLLEESEEHSGTVDSHVKKPVSSSKEKGNINEELSHWITLKKEKEHAIEETKQIISDEPSSSLCQNKLEEIEHQLSQLETEYDECQQKHTGKLQVTLETLTSQHASQISAIESQREKCLNILWEEYEDIEIVLNDSIEYMIDNDAVDGQRHKTLELVKEKLKRLGSNEDEDFLEYIAKRTKFDKEEDRIFQQQSKLSAEMFHGQKEKEATIQKLSIQRDRFHVERERERRLIKSRIKRLQRIKSSGDLQNDESLEYLKEEADKLKEAYEKVEETDHRFSLELKQKEVLGLQLEEARAKLMSSEEDREECEEKLEELKGLNGMKEKEIRDLKKQMEEERNNYLQNLKAEEYEIVDKPLVNRLHVKYRVIGNHAAAEVLKEAFMASTLPEMRKTYPMCSSPLPVRETSHGGWTYHSIQKDVTIARKRVEGPSGHLHCFLGRGVIHASADTVWEAVRNPLSRYIYDNMLKKINIVEHVEDGLKIVYMLHETSQCFMTHSRDFCYVAKERTEGRKFVLASQSIEHPKCALVPGIIRAQIVSSGWIVEPIELDGVDCSLVWYITKVHLGSNSLPWRLIDLLSKRQPLSIAFLRNYVSP